MSELSAFIDESGSDGLKDRFYLLTIVLHEQDEDIADCVTQYRNALAQKGLPHLTFHASPLMNGHDDYEGMGIADRKRLLSAFRVAFRHLPIRYTCIALNPAEFVDVNDISNAMRRRIIEFLFDNLSYFQGFDHVKVYYDNGQQSIATALRKALEYALAKDAAIFKVGSPSDYMLSQVADYICTMELTALKYGQKAQTATDEKFFGSWSQFKKGILKEVRQKHF